MHHLFDIMLAQRPCWQRKADEREPSLCCCAFSNVNNSASIGLSAFQHESLMQTPWRGRDVKANRGKACSCILARSRGRAAGWKQRWNSGRLLVAYCLLSVSRVLKCGLWVGLFSCCMIIARCIRYCALIWRPKVLVWISYNWIHKSRYASMPYI